MSNLGLEVALSRLGVPFARSNVGDRYVMELLHEKGWQIGGENSGHVLNLGSASTGDGIVAALQVLTAMLHSGLNLHDLSSGFEKYPQVLQNVRFENTETDPIQHSDVINAVKEAEQGLGKNGRVLLRKSGTEPLIRVMVESNDDGLSTQFSDSQTGHCVKIRQLLRCGASNAEFVTKSLVYFRWNR
jgi:phosphoglucosamine mutase